ncbi:hypothetical protein WMY93_018199 [Mugilogobius chulae]|uniref:PX domain-containing protein n=1 Tax=Mugilogobius chulae TaxID=88201 RepID=A0AAW0NI59_9GOBI
MRICAERYEVGFRTNMTSTLDESNKDKIRSVSVDLNNDTSLLIDIPDALCERDKVKFTVHTKTTLSSFQKPEFSVPRQHEDFIWLHDTLVETEEYAGLIIPPAPPKPDFEGPREKMHKLGEGESTMTKEEYTKMKQELEAEYLAVFKKTVQVHEVFLQRLSSHPLSVRRKNAKEMFGGFFKSMVKTADEVLISGVKEVDDFFEQEKTFLLDYYSKIKDSTAKAEKMTRSHQNIANDYIRISSTLHSISADDSTANKKHLEKLSDLFEKLRKVEGRVASDQELKLTELLRYYMRDIQAAKDLLYRRARALADYENSNKALDKARLKGKDIPQAEEHQQQCLQKFDKLSESGKRELTNFKGRRVVAFRKNLIEMAELEIKHAKNNATLLQSCIDMINTEKLQLPACSLPVRTPLNQSEASWINGRYLGTGPTRLASSKCHDFTVDHGFSSGVQGTSVKDNFSHISGQIGGLQRETPHLLLNNMDIYDPQTLGIMVFGGFMVISAVGIALVSTFSMKETSYEEALAKQRRELGKIQSIRSEKKKKDKTSEKKSRGKKKEEKPNGKIPEQEKNQEESEADSESAAAPVEEPESAVEPKPVEPNPHLSKLHLSWMKHHLPLLLKTRRRKRWLSPCSIQTCPTKAASAPEVAKATQAAAVKSSAPAPVKSTPPQAPKAAPATAKSAPAQAKTATGNAKTASTQSKPAPVLETVTKDVPVMAVPPVGSQQAPAVNAKQPQEPKKKASKKKSESVAEAAVGNVWHKSERAESLCKQSCPVVFTDKSPQCPDNREEGCCGGPLPKACLCLVPQRCTPLSSHSRPTSNIRLIMMIDNKVTLNLWL